MRTYDVERLGRTGGVRGSRLHVCADSPGEAVARVRAVQDGQGEDTDGTYVVYRRARVGRRRTLVAVFAPGGGSGGTAGVREPRRPRPDLPGLTIRREFD